MEDQKTEKAPTKKVAKLVEITCTLPEGKIFTSIGKVYAGETVELPAAEAKHFVASGKAAVPFPD